MSFLWTTSLGPVVWLALAAFALITIGRRLPAPIRPVAPAWVMGLALFAWLLLRLRPGLAPQFWSWRTTLGLKAMLGFQLDGWAWLAGFGILLLALIATILPGWRQKPGFVDSRHWALLAAAAALLIVLSTTWNSLLAAWTLMILASGLIAGSENSGSARAWSLGALSTLFLMAAPLFNGSGSLETPLQTQQFNVQAQLLLVAAALIPLGAYPFHVWLTPQAERSPGRQLALHLVPGVAVLHLLGRFDLPLLASQAWAPLAVGALLGSALAAWADHDPRRTWNFVLINRATWAILVLGLTDAAPPAAAILPLISLTLGAALWAVARVARWRYRWNLPLWLSLAVIMGLPLTPAFAPTSALGQLSGSLITLPGWIIVLLAQSLLLAALLRRQPPPDEPGSTTFLAPRTLVLSLAALVGLALWWGALPASVASLGGIAPDGAFAGLLAQFRLAGLSGWLTVLIPLALGLILSRLDSQLFSAVRGWQNNTARAAGLGWIYGLAGQVMHNVAVGLSFLADLIDGAGQFGWVLLAAIIAWLLLAA